MAVSAANTHDSNGTKPLVNATPKVRSRRGHGESSTMLHADTAYDDDALRTWLRQRTITPRLAPTCPSNPATRSAASLTCYTKHPHKTHSKDIHMKKFCLLESYI
ncbi:hypothetical protein [Actinopolyspora mortivallis]|uniref:hypothetical protein n=1 Tax=Actinopolyspora mortivallis TaxID=33906 RepID=UPI001C638AF8